MPLGNEFLTKDDWSEIEEHAVREYPNECCGIIVGSTKDSGSNKIFRCINIQDKMHRRDPLVFPRDAKTAYCIDPKEVFSIENYAKKNRLAIKGVYHSHPDHDVYFSPEDKERAILFGEPLYPDALYVIISLYSRAVKDKGIFMWNRAKNDFLRADILL